MATWNQLLATQARGRTTNPRRLGELRVFHRLVPLQSVLWWNGGFDFGLLADFDGRLGAAYRSKNAGHRRLGMVHQPMARCHLWAAL